MIPYSHHKKRHEKRHKCSNCTAAFGYRNDLERHRRQHSQLNTKFKCPEAGCSFQGATRKDNLLRHIRKLHPNSCNSTEYEELVTSQKTWTENVKWLSIVEIGNAKALQSLPSRLRIIEHKTESGKSALHLVALNGHASLIPILLERGCDLNEKDLSGNLAIHDASAAGHFEAVKILMSRHEARISARNKDGRTPLSLAAEQGYLEICHLLLSYGESAGCEYDVERPLSYTTQHSHGTITRA